MVPAFDPGPPWKPNSPKVAQRLLAYAGLCREVAALSWNETDAPKLEEMAVECVRWATGESSPVGPRH